MVITHKFLTCSPNCNSTFLGLLVWELLCSWVYNLDRRSPLQNCPSASVTATKLNIKAIRNAENKVSVAVGCEGAKSFLLPQQQ